MKQSPDTGLDGTEGPSKSERKRAAHAAQALGEELVGLNDAELGALGLPEILHDAIVAARGIGSRAGLARQRQYIGRLMRDIDLDAVRGALAARAAQSVLAAQRFHRLEAWRERLLREGAAALTQLAQLRPGLDRAAWERRIGAAAAEHPPGKAARELFRAL
ncbi:MAG TPA: ribosome biogenesis factor YjgA, partial [Steroidobacteraceae bacterium]|nr:ribosome biogenesis factor YjgA [Steroidobacteraceae bacterium]